MRGRPDTLIHALAKRSEVTNITAVSNNAGVGERGLGMRSTSIFGSLEI